MLSCENKYRTLRRIWSNYCDSPKYRIKGESESIGLWGESGLDLVSTFLCLISCYSECLSVFVVGWVCTLWELESIRLWEGESESNLFCSSSS
jgi:hypothetical protein